MGTVAAAHASAAMSNFLLQEFHALDVTWFDDIVASSEPLIQDGYLVMSDRPGLGIELDDEEARKHVVEGASYFRA